MFQLQENDIDVLTLFNEHILKIEPIKKKIVKKLFGLFMHSVFIKKKEKKKKRLLQTVYILYYWLNSIDFVLEYKSLSYQNTKNGYIDEIEQIKTCNTTYTVWETSTHHSTCKEK